MLVIILQILFVNCYKLVNKLDEKIKLEFIEILKVINSFIF